MRPEVDEVNRYQNKRQPGKAASDKKQSTGTSSGGSSRFVFCIFLIFAVGGAGGWMIYQQHTQLEALRSENRSALEYMNQSRLVMARFEGKLSATGQEMEATGMSTQEKLVFLDSEMRKLWAVSNDRNKKWIQENQARLDGFNAQSKSESKRISESINAIKTDLNELVSNMKTVSELVAQATSEASITRDEMDQRLIEVDRSLKALSSLKASIADNQEAVQSIDQSRQQSISRLVKLEQQVNQLQIDVQVLLGRPTGEYDVKVSGGGL